MVRGSDTGDGEESPTSVSIEVRYRLAKGVRARTGAIFFSGTVDFHLVAVWREDDGEGCVRERRIDATGSRSIPRNADGRVLVQGNLNRTVRVPRILRFSVPTTTTFSDACEMDGPHVQHGTYRIEFPDVNFSGRARGRRVTYTGPIPSFRGSRQPRGVPFRWSTDGDAGAIAAPRLSVAMTLP